MARMERFTEALTLKQKLPNKVEQLKRHKRKEVNDGDSIY